ncbi:MAG: HAMP domain-containing protein, partial [Actinobacteria bacterium]|nr:HAMP domain-containing protein [Actinomycetota bacterium]
MIRRLAASLRIRLLALVLLALLPTFGLILTIDLDNLRRDARSAEQYLLELTRRASSDHERLIHRAHQLLAELAYEPAVVRLDAEACRSASRVRLEASQYVANIGAAAPDGDVFCSAVALPRPVSLAALGGLGLGVILIAWLGGHLLVLRPMRALIRVTERLGAGNLRARTGLARAHAEIGQLGVAIDAMAASLESREAARLEAERALAAS